MIISTSYKTNQSILHKAQQLSSKYSLTYVPRGKNTLKQLFQKYQCPVIIVTGTHIRFHSQDAEIYFHPNIAQIRSKRIVDGETDALIEISQLKPGMSLLDCTLGLGADSLIASQVVGESGRVVAIESNFVMYLITSEGLKYYPFDNPILEEASKRIETYHQNAFDFLKAQDDDSFDVVYFDPMFDSDIKETTPLNHVRKIADYSTLNHETIAEAKRVAKQYVILKNHYLSDTFKSLGFIQQKRKTSQFHYGVIKIH